MTLPYVRFQRKTEATLAEIENVEIETPDAIVAFDGCTLSVCRE